ncbi:MAG: efflux RND transporter periplasmic adaptor subunit [Thermodesulfobacteriota bacterium]
MVKNKRVVFITLIGLLVIAAAAGGFWLYTSGKIGPGSVSGPDEPVQAGDVVTASVSVKNTTRWYDAVGTLEPRTRARIEPRVSARVEEVRVNDGEKVSKGQLLAMLDDREMQAELSRARQSLKNAVSKKQQAEQAVDASKAAFEEARSAYERTEKLYKGEAATQEQLEKARSRFLQAKAGLKSDRNGLQGAKAGVGMAEEAVVKSEIALGYTEIKSPADGRVLRRMADPGDMASPGKPLLLLRTDKELIIEAHVPETLVSRVQPGKSLKARITTLDKTVDARVEELIPYADPQTRTFLVNASMPEVKGAYPGMYAKLMIPYDKVPVILVPVEAIRRVGQLELVTVRTEDGRKNRYIKTGSRYDQKVEVLAGLDGEETLLIEESKNDGHR